MRRKRMYKDLVFYVEACESGSMFDGYEQQLRGMRIYATTAASADGNESDVKFLELTGLENCGRADRGKSRSSRSRLKKTSTRRLEGSSWHYRSPIQGTVAGGLPMGKS